MPETELPTERQVQAAQNQRLFRILNDNLRQLPAETAGPFTDAFVCECADTSCTDAIEIGVGAYDRLRRNATHFAIFPDHVFLDVERVVAWEAGYWIVEKPDSAVEHADHSAPPTPDFNVPR